jgi:homoserine O-acetyltransferase
MEGVYELDDFELQSGIVLPNAKISYSIHGELNENRDNVIVYPTYSGSRHTGNEDFIGGENALDPREYFIVVPDMFCNGLSTSPSNCEPPYDGPRFPLVTAYDNVRAQYLLLTEHFQVTGLELMIGFSMSGQQAYHWGAHYPDYVKRICAICGSARTSPHNRVYLTALRSIFESSAGWNEGECREWTPAMKKAVLSTELTMMISQDWYREGLFRALDATDELDLVDSFSNTELNDWAPMDYYHQFDTWLNTDVSNHPKFKGDLGEALRAIEVPALIMPCDRDMYFRVEDNELEVSLMPRAELRVIQSAWGHICGMSMNPEDDALINRELRRFLAS